MPQAPRNAELVQSADFQSGATYAPAQAKDRRLRSDSEEPLSVRARDRSDFISGGISGPPGHCWRRRHGAARSAERLAP